MHSSAISSSYSVAFLSHFSFFFVHLPSLPVLFLVSFRCRMILFHGQIHHSLSFKSKRHSYISFVYTLTFVSHLFICCFFFKVTYFYFFDHHCFSHFVVVAVDDVHFDFFESFHFFDYNKFDKKWAKERAHWQRFFFAQSAVFLTHPSRFPMHFLWDLFLFSSWNSVLLSNHYRLLESEFTFSITAIDFHRHFLRIFQSGGFLVRTFNQSVLCNVNVLSFGSKCSFFLSVYLISSWRKEKRHISQRERPKCVRTCAIRTRPSSTVASQLPVQLLSSFFFGLRRLTLSQLLLLVRSLFVFTIFSSSAFRFSTSSSSLSFFLSLSTCHFFLAFCQWSSSQGHSGCILFKNFLLMPKDSMHIHDVLFFFLNLNKMSYFGQWESKSNSQVIDKNNQNTFKRTFSWRFRNARSSLAKKFFYHYRFFFAEF